jgi:uncharacterized RDD family membrane protein YckC
MTPEGVPLRFDVARAGDRLIGFVLDYLIVIAISLALALLGAILGLASGLVAAIMNLAMFLVANFYFTWFEIRWRGSTPGKRALGTRAINIRGGPLRADAVFTRNLTRNLEVFLPVQVARAPESLLPGAPAWAVLVAIAWFFVIALLPLFNRDRRRLGDLIAGTIVVRAPRSALLPDLSRESGPKATGMRPVYTFRPEQLEIYGIYELQVLEDVLRGATEQRREALETVCDRIKRKIGWDPAGWNVNAHTFLTDFYGAQRRHLEQKMLMGRRKESKLVDRPPSA